MSIFLTHLKISEPEERELCDFAQAVLVSHKCSLRKDFWKFTLEGNAMILVCQSLFIKPFSIFVLSCMLNPCY